MPGKRPRPFLRTSSRPQLLQGCGYESPPPSPAAVKYVLGAPHRVVVGFDVGGAENSIKPHLDTCESPRSVLELDALHDHPRRSPALALVLADPAPSPRSVLDRSLLSGPESLPPRKEGVGLGIIAAIRREEPAVRKTTFDISVRGKPIATSEQISGVYPENGAAKEGRTSTRASFSRDVNFSDDEDDDHQLAAVQDSIFCTASPFSHCCSLDALSGDFLSACFFCKCCLMPGKDIFMYRGDRAFCSLECRYQQIVIDELKERHSAATNCYPVPSPRNSKVRRAAPSGLS